MPQQNFVNKRIIFCVFIIVGAVIVIQSCLSRKPKNPEYHAFLDTKEFVNADRNTQLNKCGSCHQEIFENEKAGPHSAAYLALTEHRDFVNSKRYECSFYTVRVNRDFEDCVGCHAPENMSQVFLVDSLNDTSRIIQKIRQNPVPPKRMGEPIRLSGIDCLSCHYDGNRTISLKHTLSPIDSIASQQISSKVIANNLNCYPCHSQLVRSFNAPMSIKETGSVMCVSCHQEYKQGKGTHYYYWQHGDKDRENPILKKFMNDFYFEPVDGKNGQISWRNTVIPHDISSGPEIIIECEILDVDSNILGKQAVRINNKKRFDEEMYKTMNQNYLFGTVGDTIPLNGKPNIYAFSLKNGSKARYLKISLFHKAQYWFPDTLKVATDRLIKEINAEQIKYRP